MANSPETPAMTLRLAMWSGPRNISTALMRSFGARADAAVTDEPLYAAYLAETGLEHPLAAEIVATHESDWRAVVRELVGPAPGGRALWYQKHMAHHLLPGMDRGWLAELTNAFLIREPRAMLRSLVDKLGPVGLEDTALPQQVALFRAERERTGATPVVVDAREVLLDPAGVLAELCARVGLAFDPAMLSWEPGPRPTDGCWGPHWYGNTLRSTGFQPYREADVELPDGHEELARRCEELYAELAEHRIVATPAREETAP